jgi:DNA anti-recombination protein RmuC
MDMTERPYKVDSPQEVDVQLEKLRAYADALRGKELQLQERERQLKQKELQLKMYRKNLLIAIREQLSEHNSYEENIKILERFRDILQFVAEDVREDLNEIMG